MGIAPFRRNRSYCTRKQTTRRRANDGREKNARPFQNRRKGHDDGAVDGRTRNQGLRPPRKRFGRSRKIPSSPDCGRRPVFHGRNRGRQGELHARTVGLRLDVVFVRDEIPDEDARNARHKTGILRNDDMPNGSQAVSSRLPDGKRRQRCRKQTMVLSRRPVHEVHGQGFAGENRKRLVELKFRLLAGRPHARMVLKSNRELRRGRDQGGRRKGNEVGIR